MQLMNIEVLHGVSFYVIRKVEEHMLLLQVKKKQGQRYVLSVIPVFFFDKVNCLTNRFSPEH